MTLLDQLPPSRPMPAVRSQAARRQLETVVNGYLRRLVCCSKPKGRFLSLSMERFRGTWSPITSL